MDSRPQKPSILPTPTALPFWDGLKQGKILLQFSPSSQKWVFYPRVLAPGTLADDLEWREVSGGGILYTFAIARYPTAPAWKASTPQLLGGTDTRVLATMIYQYAMSLRDWTQASVVAVVMIVVTMMISGVFNALSRKINPMA